MGGSTRRWAVMQQGLDNYVWYVQKEQLRTAKGAAWGWRAMVEPAERASILWLQQWFRFRLEQVEVCSPAT